MLEAVIIGSGRSTPGRFSMRRRILRLRRFNWRRTLAFTRKTSWVGTIGRVKSLDCSPKPGGFRASAPQSAWGDAWLRTSRFRCRREGVELAVVERVVHGRVLETLSPGG